MYVGTLDFDDADIYWIGLYEKEEDLEDNLLNFLKTAYDDGDITIAFNSIDEIRDAECEIMIALDIYHLTPNSSYGNR